MAHAAVISLKNTIEILLESSRISIVSPIKEILESTYEEIVSLQQVVERYDSSNSNSSERMKVLGGQIRDEVYKIEDAIESHVSQSEDLPLLSSMGLQELSRVIDCFTQTMEKMKEEYIKELENPLLPEEEEDDEEDEVPSNMVGLSDQFRQIRNHLINPYALSISITIIGMAGIGKTTLAKKIFEDELVLNYFDCRAFIKVGQNHKLRKLLEGVLAQVNDDDDDQIFVLGDDELDEYFLKSLVGRKYLIVLDDVWDVDLLKDFRKRLPDEYEAGLIFVTTRLKDVADSVNFYDAYYMRFLNEEESWELLRERVFAQELCPIQFEKAGRKIACNCEGLPLLILRVADLLSKADRTLQYWNEIAASKENSIFMEACDQISEVLYPSYNFLPQYLKTCFLYMGAFPPNYDVRCSKLVNLWIAEGFLELTSSQSLEDLAMECLKKLVSNHIVVDRQWTGHDYRVRECGLHFVFWYLCRREARYNKFLYILNRYADSMEEGIVNQRRLSIYKNILFCIKDVRDSMASLSGVRSLLCTGPRHQYQVPICSDFKLLRVLEALTIRFYGFPIEILKLVQLRYLSLTYDGSIPHSISKLLSLQYLIIYQHLSTHYPTTQSYLPLEIWDLQNLKYLHIMGRNLPDPRGAVLPNLVTVLDVGASTCTKGVLESIPNLKKLRVQIEFAPQPTKTAATCFDHISHLHKLKSFQCAVVNPQFKSKCVTQSPSLSVFTSRLQKLTLSGLGYPWKDIRNLAELPFLEALKLQCYAFRGRIWEAEEKGFLKLRYLLIEDTDLVQWTIKKDSFPSLTHLTIKHCYKLKAIPKMSSLLVTQLVDCNTSATASTDHLGHVTIDSSWDDGKIKS